MKFHLPSFLFGCLVGAGAAQLGPRLKPLVVELAAGGYRLADAVRTRIARGREDVEDLFAEARARARGFTSPAARARS